MCILKTDKTDRCYELPKKEIFLLYNNKSVMTSIRAKKNYAIWNVGKTKQNKQRNHPFKIGIKKGKEKKDCLSICFLKNKTESIEECDYTPYILHD